MEQNRFKECREKTLYSQKQVALILGVKPPQISKWESGAGSPSRENCIKLAKLYNVSVDYLLGVDEEESDPWPWPEEDETIRLFARGMSRMTPENREKLLKVARMMFEEDFDEQGKKK